MIVGAGEAGAWAINVCKSNKEYGHAVVAVDDDPAKLNQTIHGVPVKGTLEDIPELCNRYGIHSIIIAIPTLKGSKLNHVIDLCVSTHCAVQLLSDPQLVGSGAPQQGAFRGAAAEVRPGYPGNGAGGLHPGQKTAGRGV